MKFPMKGGCQCGAVRYEVRAEPVTFYLCHCTECQKQSSSAFGMSLTVPEEAFAVTQGLPRQWRRRADSGGIVNCFFCAACGTRLYHKASGRAGTLNVKPGTLDDTSLLRPIGHLWTRSAQPWVSIDDDMLVYDSQPEGFADLQKRWEDSRRE